MNGKVTRLALLTAAFLSGCRTPTAAPEGSRDHLIGWYKATSSRIDGMGEVLIPVLKIDDTYYTTFRWVEVPMRKCPVTYRVPLSRVPAAPTELPSEPDRWIGYPFPGD